MRRSIAAERGRVPLVPTSPKIGRLRAAVAARIFRQLASRIPLQAHNPESPSAQGAHGGAPKLFIHRPADLYARLWTSGLIGLGEAYQAGDWNADDLPALMTAIFRFSDRPTMSTIRKLRHMRGGARRPGDVEYTLDGARNSISHHYDISNEFFECMLDETMTYSAALFQTDQAGQPVAELELLAEAQNCKIDRLLDLTGVTVNTRLLEIGTGWGSLAIRAAQRGAHVHTITISAEQHAYTQRRMAEAGVADRVTAELRDYRELDRDSAKYDAIISVEMVEAVGERYWPLYFSILDQLLSPEGKVGLQVITMRHDRFLISRRTQSWINKYVLPGFLLPSPQAIETAVHNNTNLQVLDTLAFGAHFEATLRLWRERLVQKADDIGKIGLDEIFLRTWLFFLASSEAGFRTGHFDVYHYVLGRAA